MGQQHGDVARPDHRHMEVGVSEPDWGHIASCEGQTQERVPLKGLCSNEGGF
jgi:hypothetical protein